MSDRTPRYQHRSWSSIPSESPAPGIERRMAVGEKLMICRLRFAPFTVTAVHRHPHEQMTLVERGRVRFFIEGEERTAGPGDVLQFPSNIEHGATMMDEEVVLVDVFTPVREDFLEGAAANPRDPAR
jgi:quercetin dioxygenase-like cupin family protein